MHSQHKTKFKSNHSCNVCQERVVACNSELGKLCCSSLAVDRATHAKQVLSELPHKEVPWSSRQEGWRVELMTTFLCQKTLRILKHVSHKKLVLPSKQEAIQKC